MSNNSGDATYRDKIATVDKSGKRIWLYPKKPKGKFYNYRKLLSYVLLALLFGLPWLRLNGEPLVLFNILEGKFILFGMYFTHQDFHLFVVAMLSAVVFIALFTAIYGRLFCGWICPQTIFMEMVFRRIEYAIEGDANAQRRLAKAPWDANKIYKKGLKHFIFILLSIAIAHTFLSYIIGTEGVIEIISSPLSETWKGFIAMVIFTIVFYGVFTVLREQVCTTICPYGRLQGVLLDDDSLAVNYDFVRGEPRGKIRKNRKTSTPSKSSENPLLAIQKELAAEVPKPQGDCIDCKLCIHVCPTGIDIRDGVQLECVNCTACMDACDEVMEKIDRPAGLIRIDSYNGIKKGKKQIWTKRVMAYTGVLLALIVLESFMFLNRNDVESLMLRTPGMLFQEQDDGYISNLYNYQFINKTNKEMPIRLEIDGMEGIKIEFIGEPPLTKPNGIAEGAVFIKVPREEITKRSTKLRVKVFTGEEYLDNTKTTFLGPTK